MCASTKPMKTTPEAAISSFSVIVERDALAPWTSGVVSMPCSGGSGGRHGGPTLLLRPCGHPAAEGWTACDISRPAVLGLPRCLYLVQTAADITGLHIGGGGHGVDGRSRVDIGIDVHGRRGRRPTRADIGVRTLRGDRWWLAPLTTFVVFFAFVVYATFRAFYGKDYFSEPYLSPFYSPCLRRLRRGCRRTSASRSSWFPLSAALIILIFPLGFRMTCYYYRKAYYRAFWLSPPACARRRAARRPTRARPGSR